MPTPQYPNLANSFGQGSFIGATQDLSQMFAAQQNEQLNQQKALADQQFEAQQRPIQLASDTLKLGAAARDEDLASTLYPGKKANAVAAQRNEANKLSAPQVEQFGNSLLQLGTMAKQNGGVLQPWMKDSMNIPDSLWQELHSPGGADKFITYGKAIIDNKDKFLSQESKQGSAADIAATKADAVKYSAEQSAAARRYAADAAVRRAQVVLQGKPAKQDKQTYENYAVKLEQEADNLALAGETERASYVKQRANEYRAAAQNMKAAGAIVNQEIPNKLLFPGGTPPSPQSSQPGQAPQANVLPDPLGLRK